MKLHGGAPSNGNYIFDIMARTRSQIFFVILGQTTPDF